MATKIGISTLLPTLHATSGNCWWRVGSHPRRFDWQIVRKMPNFRWGGVDTFASPVQLKSPNKLSIILRTLKLDLEKQFKIKRCFAGWMECGGWGLRWNSCFIMFSIQRGGATRFPSPFLQNIPNQAKRIYPSATLDHPTVELPRLICGLSHHWNIKSLSHWIIDMAYICTANNNTS